MLPAGIDPSITLPMLEGCGVVAGWRGPTRDDFGLHRLAPGASPHSRSANRTRVMKRTALGNQKRAQGMPGDGLTHGPPANRKAGGSHHRFSRNNRHSLRDGFNGVLRALPRNRAFLLLSRADRSARLTPASGCQDHTTSPSVSAAFVSRYHPRPSHPRLTFGDDWPQRPSCRGGTRAS